MTPRQENSLRSLPSRFLSKFERGPKEQCWLWQGKRGKNHYGKIKLFDKEIYAHRVAYEHFIGPIPEGLFVCHTCDQPPCVNPDHLFVGTAWDNTHDMMQKGRAKHVSLLGEESGSAILTNAAVIEIRRSRLNGETCRSIASRFGVDHRTVSVAATGAPWGPVQEVPPIGKVYAPRMPVIEFGGLALSRSDWAKRLEITLTSLHWRLKFWALERALTKPPKRSIRSIDRNPQG